MATLALAVVGAAAGSAVLPAGVSVLGTTITGAAIGSQLGAMAGSYIDQSLFGQQSAAPSRSRGPRLKDLHVTTSTEGAALPRVFGRARLGGQVIWADKIQERVVRRSTDSGGGKGGMGGGGGGKSTSIEYRYYASFAVALCEGPIQGIERVWADDQEISLGDVTYRLYTGSETQGRDSLISALLGSDAAPAFRGTAYIVFEGMALVAYGNRIPQLSFEVVRALDPLNERLKGVVVIPGSGEFVYGPEVVNKQAELGQSQPANVHTRKGVADWTVGIDQLQTTLPNVEAVSLVVSWFGTDLRAGSCQLQPGIDLRDKPTTPISWSVAGRERANAYLVSNSEGRPAYGGTPSDQTVVAAIKDLKQRGIFTTLSPFILMDVPAGNMLPDPYSAATSQPTYPWRGRITCHPAPGRAGTPDKTAAAAAQIVNFVGTVTPAHFAISGESVIYSGPPSEWSLRRMVLHMAHLAKAAGGVDAFVLGSELRGLTQVRAASNTFPFVAALQSLASDVKAVLPTAKILYAADWSEYFGYQPGDGSGDVYFHLDPLWASSAIDAIGIDVYWPLSDWRDGGAHLDAVNGATSIYDIGYLGGNLQAAEGYDWFYASDSARRAQTRTPITDGSGKPWVFRYKDIKNWWLNQHFNRPGGVESGTATAWVPQSKPFWLMEIGCPAIDKGTNQPNVFVDAKSSETAVPHFSSGTQDDFMQRRFLQAFIEGFDPTAPGYVAGLNPVSSVYGAHMVDLSKIHIYAWDARPYPAFPFQTDVWTDASNWNRGHWLNGRLSAAPLNILAGTMLTGFGFTAHDTHALHGSVPGYVIDRPMSARDALQPLTQIFFFDALESGGRIVMRHRGAAGAVRDLADADLVEAKPLAPLLTLTRAQETDLPASAKLTFIRSDADYQQAVAEARRLAGVSGRLAQAEIPVVLEPERAGAIAESWLYETWAARERVSFILPPSALAIEPGDVVHVEKGGVQHLVSINEIGDAAARQIEGTSIDPEVYRAVVVPTRSYPPQPPQASGRPLFELVDLPLLRGDERAEWGYLAVSQEPWPGAIAALSSPDQSGFVLKGMAEFPSVLAVTLDAMPRGPVHVMDRATRFRVKITAGELVSTTPLQLFAGANAAAIRNAAGEWEVFQYETATLVDTRTYELSGLLRGVAGSETAMPATHAAGSRVVFLSEALAPVDLSLSEIRVPLNWRVGPSSRDIGHEDYVALPFTFKGIGLRPFAPVHVSGQRAAGNLTVTWVRRTRIGGDSWEGSDVPLSEEQELYEVDILDGTTVRRTLTSTTPSAVYTAAEQTADFGAPQASVSLAIMQISAVYGRGAAARVTL